MPQQLVQAPPRLDWVDLAKAAAIVLVVVYHVGGTGVSYLLPGSGGWALDGWRLLNSALVPVRMPLFFLASGVLAARAMERDWPALLWPRVWSLLWPFAIWSVVFALVTGFAYRPDDPLGYSRENLAAIPVGGTAYWYLAVLVVFFITARLLRRFGAPLIVLATVAVGVAPLVAPYLTDVLGVAAATNVGRLCYFAVWYAIGCFARPVVERVAELPTWPLLPVTVVTYAALVYVVYVRGTTVDLSAIMSVIGLTAGVLLSVWMCSAERVRRLARYLAGRTLPIYVLHPILLNLLIVGFRATGGDWLTADSVVVGLFLVPALSVALTAASVGLYDLSGRVGMRFLFTPPRRPGGQ
ncbi:acyltransferase [Georgenia satyanarayanai]|uniref:acyltransferase family protein n=1 Tax=Georgenia satyanarayanai TaxID=860221 RepID=UPI002040920E|nr:acyltransferase [Georgenia satyanarayanai]MCM3661065.1 acyltransferase [Georgenia satyanarayanai]